MKKVSIFVLLLVIVLSLSTADKTLSQGGGEDVRPSNGPTIQGALTSIIFGSTLPSSVFRDVTVPAGGGEVAIFGEDCCILDDLVEVYVEECFIGAFDSRGQTRPPYDGETLFVSIPGGGTYSVEYRNVASSVGPSEWFVEETVGPYTGGSLSCAAALSIDIRPGGSPNNVNPRSRGVIQVAVLGNGVDVSTLDAASASFGPGGASPIRWRYKDTNHDGVTDLLLTFRTRQTGISAGDTQACLSFPSGLGLVGCDSVRTVPAH